MFDDEIWALAQDVVDEITAYEMVKPERYEISKGVALLVDDIKYVYGTGYIEALDPYFEELEMTGNEELIGRLRRVVLDVMHQKVG